MDDELHLLLILRDLRPTRINPRYSVDVFTQVSGKPHPDLFIDFVERVKVKLPLDLNKEDVDVYIGLWCSQETLEIPKEFFDLISEQGWKVTLDIND